MKQRNLRVLALVASLAWASAACSVSRSVWIAEGQVGQFFADKAFFSTKGFVASEGTYESLLALFRIKRIVASQSPKVVLLADHSKFGRRALCKVLDVSQITMVITDSCVDQQHVSLLEKGGCIVVVAPVESVPLEIVTDAT